MALVQKNGVVSTVPDLDVFGDPMTEIEILTQAREKSSPVTRAQFSTALAYAGIITVQEAKDFAGGNSLPAFASTAISASNLTEIQKLAAEIKALSALTIHRLNPIVLMMQVAKSMTDEEVDTLFTSAAAFE
jgi:hypothetical protein